MLFWEEEAGKCSEHFLSINALGVNVIEFILQTLLEDSTGRHVFPISQCPCEA